MSEPDDRLCAPIEDLRRILLKYVMQPNTEAVRQAIKDDVFEYLDLMAYREPDWLDNSE